DQLGGGRRSRRAEIALLDQDDREAAARRVAGDARAVDAAADDEEVAVRRGRTDELRVFYEELAFFTCSSWSTLTRTSGLAFDCSRACACCLRTRSKVLRTSVSKLGLYRNDESRICFMRFSLLRKSVV